MLYHVHNQVVFSTRPRLARRRKEQTMEILCKCNHTINWHGSDGCHEIDDNDKTCKCKQTPQDIAAARVDALHDAYHKLWTKHGDLAEPTVDEVEAAAQMKG